VKKKYVFFVYIYSWKLYAAFSIKIAKIYYDWIEKRKKLRPKEVK
jgi:hypothetical protein